MPLTCQECPENHRELVFLVEDSEKFYSLMFSHSVLKESYDCPRCGSTLPLNTEANIYRCNKTFRRPKRKERKRCQFSRSGWAGTLFQSSRIMKKQVLNIVYFWLMQGRTVHNVAHEVRVTPGSVVRWFAFCREVAVHFCISNRGCFGGEGSIVELFEADFSKEKFEQVQITSQYVLGGIEQRTRKVFMVPVVDTNEDSVVEVLKQWVLPRTTLIINCLSNFGRVALKDYKYDIFRRGQKISNVDLDDHTKKIGRSAIQRIGFKNSAGYLAEWLFKKAFKTQAERFHNFLLAAAALYTSQDLHDGNQD